MTDDTELRRAAEAATPGPWRVCSDLPAYAIAAGDYRVVQTPNQNNYRIFGPSENWLGIPSDANARYIAAASPDVVLRILDERDKAADTIARLEGEKAEAFKAGMKRAAEIAKSHDLSIQSYTSYDVMAVRITAAILAETEKVKP
jgi:hypothetical protein